MVKPFKGTPDDDKLSWKGELVGSTDDGKLHVLQTADGGELILQEYKSTAKEYYDMRNISVWLKR